MNEADCSIDDANMDPTLSHSSSSSTQSSESLDRTNSVRDEDDRSLSQEISDDQDESSSEMIKAPLSSSSDSESSSSNRVSCPGEREKYQILHCGYLLKLGGTGLVPKHWNKRWFVLRSDNCLYYHKDKAEKPVGAIILSNYLVTNVLGAGTKKFSFQVTKGGARVYTLAAYSDEDKRTWMQLIAECAQKSDDKSKISPECNVHNVAIPALSIINPDCHGYIWKRGEIHKTWKRRYAVLNHGTLYYYKDMAETTAIGLFRMQCYHVSESESIGRKYGIIAIPPEPDMRTFYFATETENDRLRWVRCFRSSIESVGPSSGDS